MAPRQTSRKDTSHLIAYRIRQQAAELLLQDAVQAATPSLALALAGAHADPGRWARTPCR